MQPLSNLTREGVAELFATLLSDPKLRKYPCLPFMPGWVINQPLLDGTLVSVKAQVKKEDKRLTYKLMRQTTYPDTVVDELVGFNVWSMGEASGIYALDVGAKQLEAEALKIRSLHRAGKLVSRLVNAGDINNVARKLELKYASLPFNRMLEFMSDPVFAPPRRVAVTRQRVASADGKHVDIYRLPFKARQLG